MKVYVIAEKNKKVETKTENIGWLTFQSICIVISTQL